MAEQSFRLWEVCLLALNAILLWLYVMSTRKIERAANEQAKTAVRQADISARQARLAAEQVEGASRPVLALGGDALHLAWVNIGNGPALNIQWWVWPEEQEGPGSLEAPAGRIGFIEARQSTAVPYAPAFLINPRRKMICRYKSVGGATYRSEGSLNSDTMVGTWYEHKFSPEPRDSAEPEG